MRWEDVVLDLWFRELGSKAWFTKSDANDALIRERGLAIHERLAGDLLPETRTDPRAALAAVIALDQFPRNMFRGSPRAFAADPLALAVAKRAVAQNFDRQLDLPKRNFFYLPFQHSENLVDQQRCVELSRQNSDAEGVKWAELHADIIRRFGRFPHRNAVLGRVSTPEEQAFLDAGGFAG